MPLPLAPWLNWPFGPDWHSLLNSPFDLEVLAMVTPEELTINKLEEHKEVWLRAWCAAVTSNAIRDSELAAGWADACLESYEKKFLD